ncbi:MAG TPA: NAD(P)-binding protein [Dehalococcoidia bacterium]
MADASYDAVIVGGGNKGLVAAMYLTKYAGMSVGIFEDRYELGGGWASEENPAPGFVANCCSQYRCGFYDQPVMGDDFPEWKDYGAELVLPNGLNIGAIYEEDHSYSGTYTPLADPTGERTAKIYAKHSQRDGETFLKMLKKFNEIIMPALLEWVWNPPQLPGVPSPMDMLLSNPESGIDPAWMFATPVQVYKDLYEAPENQLSQMRIIQAYGMNSIESGMGITAFIVGFLGLATGFMKGGTHNLAHASQRVVFENGGKVFVNSPVQKILIEKGKARGIRLEDGTEVEAKKLVLTSVAPHQLIELIGKDHVSDKIRRRVENLSRNFVTIAWTTWALHEAPRWKAIDYNPDIGPDIARSFICCLADKNPESLARELAERTLGRMPGKLEIYVGFPTHWDSTYAPPGKHTMLEEQYVLGAGMLTEDEWKRWEKLHAQQVLDRLHHFAPNMTWDNVIGYNLVTPFYTARHGKNFGPVGNWAVIDNTMSQMGATRPIPELARHKVPNIESLYCTGSGWHPFGLSCSWQGYNVYKIIAGDFGLRKPWEEKGRAF